MTNRKQITVLVPHTAEGDPRILWTIKTLAKKYDVLCIDTGIKIYKKPKITDGTIDAKPEIRSHLPFWKAVKLSGCGFFGSILFVLYSLFITLKNIPVMFYYRLWYRSKFMNFKGCCQNFALVYSALIQRYEMGEYKSDAVICNDLSTLLVGIEIKRREPNCKLIYDAHEYWSNSIPTMPRWGNYLFWYFEKQLIKKCDVVYTVSPGLADLMTKEFRHETLCVPNAEPELIEPVVPFNSGIRQVAAGRVVFLYQGNIAPERNLEELITLWNTHISENNAILVIRGPECLYLDTLKTFAKKTTTKKNIFFYPAVTEKFLIPGCAEADVGLLPFRPVTTNLKFTCPNKFSQYLQAGCAVLTTNTAYMESVTNKYRCGLVYHYNKPFELITAIKLLSGNREMLEAYKEGARTAAKEFNWNKLCEPVILNAFEKLFESEDKTK